MSSEKFYTLITGASSGIGFELAKIFAKNNNNLVLVARSVDVLTQLSKELKSKYGIEVAVLPSDLASEGAAKQILLQLKAANITVDKLVNNAGFGDHGPFVSSDEGKLRAMIQVNIISLIELTRLLLPSMVEKKQGKILNVASTAAFQPGPLMAVYYATKAFVLSFSEALNEELCDSGVTVTALCPGPTISGFQRNANLEKVPLIENLQLPTSEEVALYGYKALMNHQAVAVHGFMNKIGVQSLRFSPRSLVVKLVKTLQEKRL